MRCPAHNFVCQLYYAFLAAHLPTLVFYALKYISVFQILDLVRKRTITELIYSHIFFQYDDEEEDEAQERLDGNVRC